MKVLWKCLRYNISDLDYNKIHVLQKLYTKCELAGEDEENFIGLKISPDMSPEDVTQKFIEMNQ